MSYTVKIFLLVIVFSVFVEARPENYEAIKRQAITHMKNNKYAEAIDLLNKFIAANPREPEGYNLRGLCYEKRQVYKYALLDFRRAIHLEPNNKEYKKNLERIISIWYPLLYKKIEGHKREIAINPNSAFDYLEIGKSYRWLEQWKNAEIWYDKYLALDDDASPDEIIRYSIILAKTGSIKKGEKILKKWVERYPDDWRLWSRYGYFTLWLGNRKKAENAFKTALSFKPFFKEAQDGLDLATNKAYLRRSEPRAYERKGYPIDVAFRKLRRNPADSKTRFKLVSLLIDAKRIEEAREQLNILKSDFENTEEYKTLDEQLSRLMTEKYSSLLNESIAKLKEDPNNALLVKNVASYYSRLQKNDEAKEIIEEYLALNPNDYEMKEFYADLLARAGNFAEAGDTLLSIIKKGYVSDKIVDKAANYYANDFDYDNSIKIIKKYIDGKPIDSVKELKFKLAQYYAWNYQWDDARDQIDELLKKYPGNSKYKLFQAQLIVWTVDDTGFDTAQKNFEEILSKEPDNLQAMLGLATVYAWKRDLSTAKELIDKAKEKYPNNVEITPVENFYDAQVALEDDRKKLDKRAEIGEKVKEGDYEGALELFDEYFQMDENPPKQVYKEYAQINTALKNYDEAISIYDQLLEEEYDPEIALNKANIYLWKGDSLNALNQFLELAENNPDNFDVKMGLADSYVLNQEYGEADDLYDELLEEAKDSAQVNLIKQKQDMLPMYGITAGLNTAFQLIIPYNLSLIPSFVYYSDNQELTYTQYGLRAEMGLLRYFTFGGSVNYTDLLSLTNSQHFTEYSGIMFFHPFEHFSVGGSIGHLIIEREQRKNIGTLEARWFSDNLLLRIGYKDTDTRLFLFSPYLINYNLDAYIYHFSCNYKLKNKYKFLLFYQYFEISDNNRGNDLRFRLGRAFQENVYWGYEFFFSDFAFTTGFYYSPQEYSTHSIWVDYEYKEINNLNLILGGEIGYAPSVDYIVGYLFADANYKVYDNLSLNGRATFGQSYRFDSTYRYISVFLSAFWNIW